jgi:hypothetical protein
MRPVRTIVAVLFIATIAVTGCSAHPSADQPSPPPPAPNPTHAPQPPTHRPDPAPVDRQAPIYTAVLRQYLTSGGGHDGGDASFGGHRFPQIFVLDRAMAGVGVGAQGQGAPGGARISPAVRGAITHALADVGPLTFVPSPDAVIVDRDGCARVRDQGILITLGPVDGVGDQVQVGVYGFVACLGASSLTYRVEQTSGGWRVAGVAAWGPVS